MWSQSREREKRTMAKRPKNTVKGGAGSGKNGSHFFGRKLEFRCKTKLQPLVCPKSKEGGVAVLHEKKGVNVKPSVARPSRSSRGREEANARGRCNFRKGGKRGLLLWENEREALKKAKGTYLTQGGKN